MADRRLATARRIYRNRRLREQAFTGTDIFGEPAWDILIDLFIAHFENKTVSVTSACVASGVPVTTALRWLGHLSQKGLILRAPDNRDRRRMLVSLTPKALGYMISFFDQMEENPLFRSEEDVT